MISDSKISFPKFRLDTWDVDIFRSVVYLNEYKIPNKLNNIKVIDIGGHIGSFSWLCAYNEAKEIFYCEALKDNFDIAQDWINNNFWKVKNNKTLFATFNAIIWKEDENSFLTFQKSSDHLNTGGGSVLTNEVIEELKINTIPFDDILKLRLYNNSKKDKVLLKIDCEGSEYPILFSSKKLDGIDYICGEYHDLNDFIPEIAKVEGCNLYNASTLQHFLKEKGFIYTFFDRSYDIEGNETKFGHFWASRTNDNFFVDLKLSKKYQEKI